MKKILVIVTLISLVGIIYAQKIKLDVSAEYATVDMKDMNKELEDAKSQLDDYVEFVKNMGGTASSSLTKFSNGVFVSLGLGYEVIPNLSIGPKIGYLNCFPAEVSAEGSILLFEVPQSFKLKYIGKTYLILPMIGGLYSFPISDKLTFSGGLYLGYALASFIINTEAEGIEEGTSQKYEVPYEGEGFTTNISLGINYTISENVGIGFNFGYRIAKIDELKATKDVEEAEVKKGDILKDEEDKVIPADYSGINAGLKVYFKF